MSLPNSYKPVYMFFIRSQFYASMTDIYKQRKDLSWRMKFLIKSWWIMDQVYFGHEVGF